MSGISEVATMSRTLIVTTDSPLDMTPSSDLVDI